VRYLRVLLPGQHPLPRLRVRVAAMRVAAALCAHERGVALLAEALPRVDEVATLHMSSPNAFLRRAAASWLARLAASPSPPHAQLAAVLGAAIDARGQPERALSQWELARLLGEGDPRGAAAARAARMGAQCLRQLAAATATPPALADKSALDALVEATAALAARDVDAAAMAAARLAALRWGPGDAEWDAEDVARGAERRELLALLRVIARILARIGAGGESRAGAAAAAFGDQWVAMQATLRRLAAEDSATRDARLFRALSLFAPHEGCFGAGDDADAPVCAMVLAAARLKVVDADAIQAALERVPLARIGAWRDGVLLSEVVLRRSLALSDPWLARGVAACDEVAQAMRSVGAVRVQLLAALRAALAGEGFAAALHVARALLARGDEGALAESGGLGRCEDVVAAAARGGPPSCYDVAAALDTLHAAAAAQLQPLPRRISAALPRLLESADTIVRVSATRLADALAAQEAEEPALRAVMHTASDDIESEVRCAAASLAWRLALEDSAPRVRALACDALLSASSICENEARVRAELASSQDALRALRLADDFPVDARESLSDCV
jgi:hypothetical protein